MAGGKRNQRRAWKRLCKGNGRSFCLVYGLRSEGGPIRYIGQARQLPRDRLGWFQRAIDRKRASGQRLSPVEYWIDELAFFGLKPEIVVLDSNATWDISEIIYIDRYRQTGHDLLNVTRGGGDGTGNLKRESRGAQLPPLTL